MQNYDCFSNLCIDYYYGTFTNCNANWCGYDQVLPYSKLYFVTGGECEVKTEAGIAHGIPGRMLYVPPRTKHSFYHISENYVKKYWLHFSVETVGDDMKELLSLPMYVDVPENRRREAARLYEKIFAEGKKNTPVSNLCIKAYILELFSMYVELSEVSDKVHTEKDKGHKEKSLSLTEVMQFINANLDKKLTVDELSGMLHIHPNYFIRMFKKKVGVSPLKYINKMRFERVLALFSNESMNISDIMSNVGFEDYSSFSNFFKGYSGYSPKNYRKIFLKKDE